MKKCTCVFLLLITLITSSCEKDANFSNHEAEYQLIPPSMNGISITTKDNQMPNEEYEFTFSLHNSNDYEIIYGSKYSLEERINNTWYKIKRKDIKIVFTSIGHKLSPRSTSTETYNLLVYEQRLTPGIYRIVKDIHNTKLAISFEIIE